MLVKSDENTFLSNFRLDSFSAVMFMRLSLTFKASAAITCFPACLMQAAANVNLSYFAIIYAYFYFFHSSKTTFFFLNIIF